MSKTTKRQQMIFCSFKTKSTDLLLYPERFPFLIFGLKEKIKVELNEPCRF